MRSLFPFGHGKAVRLLVSVITALTALGALPGNAAANTVIDLTYDSVMDMVRPEVHPGIAVHHNLQITVSGGGNLSEGRNRSAGPYQDRNAMMQVLSSSGDDAAYASWRTAPDGRLVRIQNDPQSTRTMTVTLLRGQHLPPRGRRPAEARFQRICVPAHLNPHDRVFLDLPRHPHFLHDPLSAGARAPLRYTK